MLQGDVDETLEKFSEMLIISLVQRPLVQKVSALQNQNRALEAQVKGLSKQIAQLRQECQKHSAPINSPFDGMNLEDSVLLSLMIMIWRKLCVAGMVLYGPWNKVDKNHSFNIRGRSWN